MTGSGKTLEQGARRWGSRAKGEAQRTGTGTGTGRDPGSLGQAAHLSLRYLLHRAQGKLRCPEEPTTLLRVSDVLCRVSSVCNRGRVSGSPKNKGLAIIILRVLSGRRIGGDLESFGEVVTSG